MRVLWLCDEPGWAFDNACQTIARRLPQHEHRFVYYKRPYYVDSSWPDVVVINHPEVIKWFPNLAHKMVLRFASRMHNLRLRVLWFCDERGWAYDQRAHALAERMPDFEHHFAYYFDYETDLQRAQIVQQYDVTVLMCGAYGPLMGRKLDRAVVCVGGFRILEPMGIRVHYANDQRA